MDGNWITAMRTGAVAAHTVMNFAKKEFHTIGMIGLGNTARSTLLVLAAILHDKELPLAKRTCEYVGICKMSKDFAGIFKERMHDLIMMQKHNLWWENVLYSFTEEREIYTVDVEGKFWSEIDYFDDYERILRHIEKENFFYE